MCYCKVSLCEYFKGEAYALYICLFVFFDVGIIVGPPAVPSSSSERRKRAGNA